MADNGINGDTFGVKIDLKSNTVTIAGEKIIDNDYKRAHLFAYAYRMGREHKKMELRKVLNIN